MIADISRELQKLIISVLYLHVLHVRCRLIVLKTVKFVSHVS